MQALEKNTVALGIKIDRKPRGLFIFNSLAYPKTGVYQIGLRFGKPNIRNRIYLLSLFPAS